MSQESWQFFKSGLDQDGEIAPIKYVPSLLAGLSDQPAEMGIQLRRSTGYVHHLYRWASGQQFHDSFGHLAGHDFGPFGPRIDVAVMAGLVAQLADVDLQRPSFLPDERSTAMRVECRLKVWRGFTRFEDRQGNVHQGCHQQQPPLESLSEQQERASVVTR